MKNYILVIVSLLLIALSFYFGNAVGVSKQTTACLIRMDKLKEKHQAVLDSIIIANEDGFQKFDCYTEDDTKNALCAEEERTYLDTLMNLELRKCFAVIDDSINKLKADPLSENLIYWRNVRTRLEQSQLKWELFFLKEQELTETLNEGKANSSMLLHHQAILDFKDRIESLRQII